MTIVLEPADNAAPVPPELQARKPTRIRLDPAMTGADMVLVIANENIADLRHNLQVFMIAGSAVSVHKSRVSARRIRVLLKGIRALMQPECYKPVATGLKLVMTILHQLRQHDVVSNWMHAGGVDASDRRHDRAAMVRDAQAQLSDAGMVGFLDEVAKLMRTGGWRKRGTEVLDQPCLCIVPGIIDRCVQTLYRAGGLDKVFDTTGDYHGFRKDLKQLRYWLEFTRSLFAKKDITAWRKTTKLLQSTLGSINDLDEARMTGHDTLVGAGAWGPRRSAAADLAVSLSETLFLLPKFWR